MRNGFRELAHIACLLCRKKWLGWMTESVYSAMACVILTALAVGISLLESYRSTPVLFHIIFFSGQRLFHCLMLHVPSEMAVSFGLKITQQRADRFPMRSFAPAYLYKSALRVYKWEPRAILLRPHIHSRGTVNMLNLWMVNEYYTARHRPQLVSCCCKFISSRVCVTYGNNRRWS